MRNRSILLLLSFLLVVVGFAPAASASGSATLTATAAVNAAKIVSITGTISSGAGQQVAVVVTNPSGNVDFIDQTTSGSGGGYQFAYLLDEETSGTYKVSVGGSGVDTPAATAFTYTAADSAPSATVTASAHIDNATKVVTITGNISTGAGHQVAVVVKNPSGNVDYIDQTTSGSDGSYRFTYTLDESSGGTYAVTVGGSGVSHPATTSFVYDAPDTTEPNPPTGSPPTANGPGENKDQQVVNPNSLTSNRPNGEPIVVEIADGKHEVLLPANAADLVGSHDLELKSGRVSLTIPHEVLKQLQGLVGSDELTDAQISLKIVSGTQEEANELVPAGVHNGTAIKTAGQTMRFELAIVAKDGKTSSLTAFSKPIQASFAYDEETNENLLGVYYYNEQSHNWDYIGGEIDREHHLLTADLPHFSTYAVLEYDKTFQDVPADYWASATIKTLAAKHVISGISDTAFAPKQEVTRAEFTALLTRAFGLKASGASPFRDVAAGAWYAGDVTAAYEAKLVSGRSADIFQPNAPITREEMAVMIVRAYEYAGNEPTQGEAASYADAGQIAAWAAPSVSQAATNGLMNGVQANRFAPKAHTNRAESAQAIYNLLTVMKP